MPHIQELGLLNQYGDFAVGCLLSKMFGQALAPTKPTNQWVWGFIFWL